MTRRLRAFVTNRNDRRRVAGASVSLVLRPKGGGDASMRLAFGTSDTSGCVSIDLDGPAQDLDHNFDLLLGAVAEGLATGKTDAVIEVDGDQSSRLGLLADHGFLKDAPALAAMLGEAASATDTRRLAALYLDQIFARNVAIELSTKLSADNRARPGTVVHPDPVDFDLSPESFFERRPLTLGADGCEHIVPARLPLLVYPSVRLNVRTPLSAPDDKDSAAELETGASVRGPAGRKGAVAAKAGANGRLADINTDLQPDERILWAEALHFEQTIASLGHSLGEIKYSLALAPGEAVRIAVIDWSRQDKISRTDKIRNKEHLLHSQTADRDIDEIVTGNVNEQQGGFSAMTGSAVGADMTIPAYNLSLAGRSATGFGGSYSAGNRDMRADSQQDIHNAVLQRSNSQRTLNSTVVIQAGQDEQNYLATRIVANMNRGHALTIQYYEVLRHLRLSTAFRKRDWAILVPLRPFRFTNDLARRFRTQLEPGLIDPRQRPGFDALERMAVGEAAYAAPGAGAGGAGAGSGRNVGGGGAGTGGVAAPKLTVASFTLTIRSGPGQEDDTWGRVEIAARLKGNGGVLSLFSKDHGSAHAFKGRSDSRQEDGFTVTTITRSDPSFDPTQLDALLVRWRVSQFGPEKDLDGWDLSRVKLSASVAGYPEGARDHVFLDWQSIPKAGAITFPRPADVAKDIDPFPALDFGLIRRVNALMGNPVALDGDDKKVKHANAIEVKRRYQDATVELASPRVVAPAAATAPSPVVTVEDPEPFDPLTADQGKAPPDKTADTAAATALVNHLNANNSFYNAQVWLLMDPRERRLRLRDSLGPYYDATGDAALAVMGNHIALPYGGPTDFLPEFEKGTEPELNVSIMTLPTRGVFAEAHLGHCNGAELRDVTRLWNFSELPVSLLPNIEGLTPSPRGTPPTIGQPSLPGNILNIVNAPNLPDPAGIKAATDILGRSDIFRDMSGLKEVAAMVDKLIEAADPPPIMGGGDSGGADIKNQAGAIKDKVNDMLKGEGSGGAGGGMPKATDLYDAFRVGKQAFDESGGVLGGSSTGGGSGGGGGFDPDSGEAPSPLGTLGQIIQTVGATGGTGAPKGTTAKAAQTRVLLVGDPGGPVDLAGAMSDYINNQRSVSTARECVQDTLLRFAAVCRSLGATARSYPIGQTGQSFVLPDMGMVDGSGEVVPVKPYDFMALWMSNTGYNSWLSLPQDCRGNGAPGALHFAKLTTGAPLEGVRAWPPGLVTGSPVQFWLGEASRNTVRDTTNVSDVAGHSGFMLERFDDDYAMISDYMNTARQVRMSIYGYHFVLGAILSQARLVEWSNGA